MPRVELGLGGLTIRCLTVRLHSRMVGQSGVEPLPPGLQPGARPLELPAHIEQNWSATRFPSGLNTRLSLVRCVLPKLVVEVEGIEPSSPGCRPGVLPLNDTPTIIWSLRQASNP